MDALAPIAIPAEIPGEGPLAVFRARLRLLDEWANMCVARVPGRPWHKTPWCVLPNQVQLLD
jgi:hypothetical protein